MNKITAFQGPSARMHIGIIDVPAALKCKALRRLHWTMLLSSFAALEFTTVGFAQEASRLASTAAGQPAIAEIVVTAQKREENVQQIPASVTAISSDEIDRVGVRGLGDINQVVTNLNAIKTQDGGLSVTMRGVGSFFNVPGVGFYYDDVQIFSDFGFTERLSDVDHIEVLKGPQGTLYGGNNIGGAIKYILKKPEYAWSGEAEASTGSYGTHSEYAAITGPIADNHAAFRLSVYADQSDGVLYNAYDRSRTGGQDEYGGRFALRVDQGNLHVNFGLRASELTDHREQLVSIEATPQAYSRTVSATDPVKVDRYIVAPTLTVDYDLGGGYRATSISAFDYTHVKYLADSAPVPEPPVPFQPLFPVIIQGIPYFPLLRIDDHSDDRVYSQELRLLSPTEERLTWLAGAYYFYRMTPEVSVGSFRNTRFQTLFQSPANAMPKHEQHALFGSATYKITDQLALTAGGRVNWADERVHNNLTGLTTDVKGTAFLPAASLAYHFDPDVMAYLSVTKGLQPGGASVVANAPKPWSAETTTSYELGLKSELFSRRVQLNAALFYTDYSNRTFTNTVLTAQGSQNFNQNIGDAKNVGGELEMEVRASRELTLHAALSGIEATWNGGVTYFNPTLGRAQSIAGFTSPYVPKWTASASADWVHQLTVNLRLRVRSDAYYFGKQYWDVLNTYQADAYALLGASVGFSWKQLDVFLQGRNLTNKRYNTIWFAARDTGAAANFGNPGDPRTWTLTASAKF
jgi:iron complex outermembrane receptor protein